MLFAIVYEEEGVSRAISGQIPWEMVLPLLFVNSVTSGKHVIVRAKT